MAAEQVDALVIFGATGDLAKLETFPALVGLVDRGVLDVPVIGVAKNGWGLEQFRDYAVASLKLNNMDPDSAPARKMLGLLRTWTATSTTTPPTTPCRTRSATARASCSTSRCRRRCSAGSRRASRPRAGPRATGSWWRSRSAPTWTARSSWTQLMHQYFPEDRDLPGGPLAGPGPGGERAVRPVRQLGHRAAAQPGPRGEHPDHHGRGVRRLGPGPVLRPDRRDPGRAAEPPAPGAGHGDGRPAGRQRAAFLAGRQVPAALRDQAAGAGGRGPRPVRGLPRRGRGGPALHRGDVRGRPAGRRVVALVRGAGADPGGQVPAGHRHRGHRAVQARAVRHLRPGPAAGQQHAAVPGLPGDRGRGQPGRQEARRGLGAAERGAGVRRAARLGPAALRPADRRRAGRGRAGCSPGRTRSRRPGGWWTRCSATSSPVHPYAKATWGPKEADRLLPARDIWLDPA